MLIGQYFKEDLLQEWYLKELDTAKRNLAQFKTLNRLFDEFKDYENKKYSKTKNIILRYCLPNINESNNIESIKKLEVIEYSLNLFDISNWNQAELNDFKSRLTSDEDIDSITAYTELIIAKHFANIYGEKNVELFPKLIGGGKSDVLVKLDGKSVYIEIGNLSDSIPEIKIQEILNTAAKHLGEKLEIPCFFHLIIDTAEFVFEDNRINVEKSILKLTSEIEKYGIFKLAGFKGWISIDEVIDCVSNYELYIKLRSENHLPPQLEEVLTLIENPIIKDWIDYCDIAHLGVSNLIKSIMSSPSSSLLVEIHTEGFFPSKAAIAEQGSFINHILRNVERQLVKEEQIQPGEPNIIIIQGWNWTVLGVENFEPLGKKIKEFFEKHKEKYLSGIAVFGTEYDRNVYFNNEYTDESSKLGNSELTQLGLNFKPAELF